MASLHIYDLNSCGTHPSILGVTSGTVLSAFDFATLGALVYLGANRGRPPIVPAETYTLDYVGITTNMATWVSIYDLQITDLVSCADTNKDKMYKMVQCGEPKNIREVLLTSAQTIGDVLVFGVEDTAWIVHELISTYDEILTITATYANCTLANTSLSASATLSAEDERTIGYAALVTPIKTDPVDRGFNDCCFSLKVLADLSDDASYKNDFTSVFYQRQTPADTISYQIIKVGGGTTNLLDGTHGVLYDFAATHHNPDLTYFKVEWRKIYNLLGLGQYTIRMNIVVGGLPSVAVDSNTFNLKAFSINNADGTTRFDGSMDGRLEEIKTDFKNSGFETSLRISGYFGNRTPNIEKEDLVYSSKKGISYYKSQITMKNDDSFSYEAENIPDCISKQWFDFLMFSNDIQISDYNKNNHSYDYELFDVELDEISEPIYPPQNRGVTIQAKFKRRSKNQIKTNC